MGYVKKTQYKTSEIRNPKSKCPLFFKIPKKKQEI